MIPEQQSIYDNGTMISCEYPTGYGRAQQHCSSSHSWGRPVTAEIPSQPPGLSYGHSIQAIALGRLSCTPFCTFKKDHVFTSKTAILNCGHLTYLLIAGTRVYQKNYFLKVGVSCTHLIQCEVFVHVLLKQNMMAPEVPISC